MIYRTHIDINLKNFFIVISFIVKQHGREVFIAAIYVVYYDYEIKKFNCLFCKHVCAKEAQLL